MAQNARFKKTQYSARFMWERLNNIIPLSLLRLFTSESKAGNIEEGAVWRGTGPVTDGPALQVQVPWFHGELGLPHVCWRERRAMRNSGSNLGGYDMKVYIHKILSSFLLRLVYFIMLNLSKKLMGQKKNFNP